MLINKINKALLAGLVAVSLAANLSNRAKATSDTTQTGTTDRTGMKVDRAGITARLPDRSSVVGKSSPVSDADHVQLTRLLTEVIWRVDHRKARTVYELFTKDGELNVVSKNRGQDAIRAWGLALDNQKNDVYHVLGNPRFINAGPNRTRGTSTLTVYKRGDNSGAATVPFVALGEDHDKFVRTTRGWRFRARKWVSFYP